MRWPEFALALLAVCAGCSRDWRTDLWYSPAPQGRSTPRLEPQGSFPLFARPRPADRDEATSLKAPYPADDAALERGRILFADRCIGCHNDDGHGNGPVSRSFPPAPDLAFQTVREKSDGYLYGTIVLGGRAMPSMNEGLDERDRWDLVHWVRRIQSTSAGAARGAR